MFDVDGTLVESYDFDEQCFLEAVQEVTGLGVINNWETYPHVTDRGILGTFIERQAQQYSIEELEELVKPVFVSKIKDYLASNPAQEVEGAIKFVEHLKSESDVVLSIATGGWGDTAVEKLKSAGFDLSGIPLASSNDHHSRIEIMKLAIVKAVNTDNVPLTYFGDAEWDVRACKDLGVNLVIVGSRVNHNQVLSDFTNIYKAMSYVQ